MSMRIAIPLARGEFSMHFGHCDEFAIIDVDSENKKIIGKKLITPPAHEPGALPECLSEQEVSLIISGGMGRRAQMLFEQYGIRVLTGARGQNPDQIAEDYLNDTLLVEDNICDH